MKKRVLFLAMMVVLVVSLFCIPASAASGTCGAEGDNLTWELDYNTKTLTISGTGAMADYSNTSAPWCSGYGYYNYIKTTQICDGVTTIGDRAFYGCSEVDNLSLPGSLESIGYSAFYSCRKLSSVEIPEGVKTIENYAFNSCSGLISVTIPDSLESIGSMAFYSCKNVTEVHIASLDVWFAIEFGNAYSNPLASTGGDLYVNGELLCEVDVPNGVEKIGTALFSGCKSLLSVTIPDSVTTIGASAFSGCSGLTAVTISDSVTVIEASAFSNCGSLASVSMGSGVTTIGNSAFEKCNSLRKVYYAGTREQWQAIDIGTRNWPLELGYYGEITGNCGENAVWKLEPTGVLTISGTGAMENYDRENTPWYENRYLVRQVVIDTGITSVGGSAFYQCGDLVSVDLADSVTTIGIWAFYECESLTEIKFSNNLATMEAHAFSYSGLKSVELPESLTTIGACVFQNCESLAFVDLPDNMITIPASMFNYCDSLHAIDIPDGVKTIGSSAFANTGLYSVVIPDSVTSLGEQAFNYSSVTTVVLGKGIESIEYATFWGSSLTSIVFRGDVWYVGEYAFTSCSSLKDVYGYRRSLTSNICYYNECLTNATYHYIKGAYTNNGDLTHTAIDTCADCGVTLGDAVTSDCVDEILDAVCDLCGGAIPCSHTGETVLVNAPNGDRVTHKVTVNCAVCKEELEAVIDKEECTFSDGVCTECGNEELVVFSVAGSNVTLGNELVVNIMVKQADITEDGLTAFLTHHAETGDVVSQLEQSAWISYMNKYYKFSVPVAAAQMADQISIEIRDEAGNVHSQTYSTSIRDYVDRVYASSTDKVKTLMVDMLNYGAAAQEHFDYQTETMANASLTEAQQAMATPAVECKDIRVKGKNYVGSNLSLQDRILLNILFTGVGDAVRETMYAEISFTGALGTEVSETVEVEKLMNSYIGVAVDQIVLADASCPVTVTLYYADGSVYGTATDSVESYIARMGSSALYSNIMKFAAAALAYKQ